MKAKPTITIPRSELGTSLAEVASIKRDMTDLLAELETQAIRQSGNAADSEPTKPSRPGTWRQDSTAWTEKYLKP